MEDLADHWTFPLARRITYFSLRSRVLFALGTAIAYIPLVLTLQPLLGESSILLSIFPVSIASLLFGFWGGLLASLLTVGLNLFLYFLTGQVNLFERFGSVALLAFVVLAVVGALLGRISDVGRRLEQELLERRRAEADLKRSKDRYRSLFEGVPVGLYRTTPQGNILDASPALVDMLGFPDLESLISIHVPDLYLNRDDFVFEQELMDREGVVHGYEMQLRRYDGDIIWVRDTFRTVLDANGQPQYYEGSLEDITQRKTMEEALRESRERFYTLVETMLDGFAILSASRDANGRIADFYYEYINEAGCSLNGRSRVDQIGATLLELAPGHWEAGLFEDYVQVVETGHPFARDTLLVQPVENGAVPSGAFDVRAIKLEDGVTVTWREVSERQRMEAAEREQRMLAEALRDTAAALSGTLEFEEVLDRILTNIGKVVPHDAANIMLMEGGFARLKRSQGYTNHWNEVDRKGTWFPLSEMYTLRLMAETGKPLAIPDTRNDPEWSETPHSGWLLSYAGAPVRVHGETVGFLNLNSATPGFYSQEKAERLQAFADQAAVAIKNAQLLESERRRTTQLARANHLIAELGRVATQVAACKEMESVLKTLGGELKQLGIGCLVALQLPNSDQLSVNLLSLDVEAQAMAEHLAGTNLQNARLSPELFPSYTAVMLERRAVYSRDLEAIPAAVFPGLSGHSLRQFAQLMGAVPGSPGFFLPLSAGENPLGSLWMWGPDLEENDLPAAALFAGQVAVALENARLYLRICQLAVTDELTGIYNRRGLFEAGHREVERALRFGHPLSAVMIDIDLFKNVNDHYNHLVGDQVLRAFAAFCQRNMREVDLIGRLGGEEFIILLPEANLESAQKAAERLRHCIQEHAIPTDLGEVRVTVSMGVAAVTKEVSELTGLIRRADQALLEAKNNGRNQVAVLQETSG